MKKSNIAVLKIGSKSIAGEDGQIRTGFVNSVVHESEIVLSMGWQMVIVSSGAVLCGRNDYNMRNKTTTDQVCSMVGQRILMNHWAEAFGRVGIPVGQGLYTNRMLGSLPERKQIIRDGLLSCFETGVMPILNENDAAVLDELMQLRKEGDNDHFASLVGCLLGAEVLVFLTTVPGVIDPASDSLITKLDARDGEILGRLETWPGESKGGMISKVTWGQHFVCNTKGRAVIKQYDEPLALSRAIRGLHDGTSIELM